MDVQSSQDQFTTTSPWGASPSVVGQDRTHHNVLSRRAHRAAHQASLQEKHRWMWIGAAGLTLPFVSALAIVEFVH